MAWWVTTNDTAQINNVRVSLTQAPDDAAIDHSSYCAANNLVYKYGGYSGTACVNTLAVFNPQNNIWTPLTSSPATFGTSLGGLVPLNNKLYAFGGFNGTFGGDGGGPSTKVYEYDIASDTWAAKSDQPTATCGPFTVYNNVIYKSTGESLGGAVQETYSYNPVTDVWRTLANHPDINGRQSSSIVGYGGYIWHVGGDDGGGGHPLTCFKYNISTDTWSSYASIPAVCDDCQVGLFNDKMYVIGASATGLAIYIYDFVNDKWTVSPNTITTVFVARCQNQSAFIPSPQLLGG